MNKIYDSGMVVGRFQTFHLGHQHLIDSALQLCDRVLVFVGSSQEYGTERNPLNVETRIRMLRQIYENDKEVMIYPLPDLTEEKDITPEWGKYVLDNCKRYLYKNPEIFVFGNDTNRGSSCLQTKISTILLSLSSIVLRFRSLAKKTERIDGIW